MRLRVIGDYPRLCPRSGKWLQPGTVIDVAEHQLPKYYLFTEQVPDDTPATSWAGGVVKAVNRFFKPAYKCPVCNAGFESPEGLQIHLGSQRDRPHREHGLEIAKLEIYTPGDGSEFTLKNGKPALNGAKREGSEEPLPVADDTPSCSCPWCGAPPFKSATGLAKHLRNVHPEHYPDLATEDLPAWVAHVEARQQAQGRPV